MPFLPWQSIRQGGRERAVNINPVVFVSIAIGALGVILLAILLVRSIRIGKTRPDSLKRHRDTSEGVCDLLNWGSVIDNGVILNKNGSLMASWQYAGEDDDNSTDDGKNYVAAKLNQVFASLGDGWMLHCDNVRMGTAKYIDTHLNHFPDKVSYAIEEERRRFFTSADTLYDSVHVLTLTYYPPLVAQAKFVEMFFDDDRKARKTPRGTLILEKFKKDIAVFEAGLSSVFKMARLGGHDYENEDGEIIRHDEQLQFLQMCLTGNPQPVILPKNPVRLDMVLGGQELWGGIIPRIGDKFINIVSIEGFPGESYAGILKAIYDVPVNCRFSSRFIFLDRHQALAAATKEMKKWKQKELFATLFLH